MPSTRKPVRLLRSQLTGRIYAVTRYRENQKGIITAETKHDVTDDFYRILNAPELPIALKEPQAEELREKPPEIEEAHL